MAWLTSACPTCATDTGYRRHHGRLIEAYAQLMTHADPATRDAASHAWADWEDHHISIGVGGVHRNPRWDDDEFRHVFTTLVTHYWADDAFLAPPILEQMDRLVVVARCATVCATSRRGSRRQGPYADDRASGPGALARWGIDGGT